MTAEFTRQEAPAISVALLSDEAQARLRADNRLLAMAWKGWTPDWNTQTEAEATATEAEIDAAADRALKAPQSVEVEGTSSPLSALDHLGVVLSVLAELSPSDRCRGLDEAMAFYNAARPDAQVVPMPGYVTRLVQVSPFDWPLQGPGLAPAPQEQHSGQSGQDGAVEGLCTCLTCQKQRRGGSASTVLAGPRDPGWSYGCAICGNKRCPHHTDHSLACTNSNDIGQIGSPQQQPLAGDDHQGG